MTASPVRHGGTAFDVPFRIREATPADGPAVLRVYLEGLGPTSGAGQLGPGAPLAPDHFTRRIADAAPWSRRWVATDEAGTVLGWQSLFPATNSPLVSRLWAESST